MERTVPSTASEEIELYLRTIYSLLRSTTEVQIRTLEEVHTATNSLLHPGARGETPDVSAFIYSMLRLPDCIPQVQTVLLGQSSDVFLRHGYEGIENWQPVSARARRRRCFYDGEKTLASYIASRSDIEDVIPVLTAFQIEWNKIHTLLNRCSHDRLFDILENLPGTFDDLAEILQLPEEDLERLWNVWASSPLPGQENGWNAQNYLLRIHDQRCSFGIRLLSGSLSEYWRATRLWWDHIEHAAPQLLTRPVYFISSNTHSITNLLTGFAIKQQSAIEEFLNRPKNVRLRDEWQAIQSGQTSSSRENFLYYVLKKLQQSEFGAHLNQAQQLDEQQHGITHIVSEHSFDVDAQIIELNRLDPSAFDSRVKPWPQADMDFLRNSNALILNIDYPLGLGAYNILAKVAEHASPILGVYIMGKAATLNGVRGDVMIPNVVQDEHSQNTYLFQNAFSAADVAPYLIYGTVLDNQKAVSVLGTFLQNARIMDVIYREGYTDIEMEGGPYLSAIYEMYRPKRHPVNEIVNLYGVPFDIGILHYASDTPLSKGKNLGAGTLSYMGMDSTYACSVAILRRIFALEKQRLSS